MYPQLSSCTLSLHFVKKHLIYLEDYLEEEKRKARGKLFDELLSSPPTDCSPSVATASGLTQETEDMLLSDS